VRGTGTTKLEMPGTSLSSRMNQVHLVVTSPPYWNLKRYNENPNQMGHIQDYETFLAEPRKVWTHGFYHNVMLVRFCPSPEPEANWGALLHTPTC